MRILEDEDIIERFKRGAISDRKFLESMKALPGEDSKDAEEPKDNRITVALEDIANILRGMTPQQAPPAIGFQWEPEIKRMSNISKTATVNRDDKGLMTSIRFGDKTATVNRDENGLIQSMTIEEAENGE